jgi:SWI/SNF-related matrix-associated actin-dependent regulator of chromatin subfamily A-like protein 1
MSSSHNIRYGHVSSEVNEEAIFRANQLAATLFPHQVEGVAFLLGRRRAILADDMGLGKTRQAIVALKEAEPEGPYLIVSPASVKRNWQREIEAALGAVTVLVADSSATEDQIRANNWVIVNYDILSRMIGLLEAIDWRGLVFDEAHYIKNHQSQRSKHSRALARVEDRASDLVVYALTGTPLTNRPRDLFPLLQLVRHPMAKSFISFAKRYCAAEQNQYGWQTDGASNLDELAVQLTGVMLRRSKNEVLSLPPKLRTWNAIDGCETVGAPEIRKAFELLLGIRRGPQDRARLIAILTTARRKLALAKIKSTIDLVQSAVDQGEKVIVFSGFDEPIQKIVSHFGEQAVALTGATPTAKRQDLVDAFQQDGKVRVFVSNIVAGGIGLNLTAARQVVFNDLDWVPANHWQAEDRAYRIGQTGTVNVTYQVALGTIDEFVHRVLEAKALLVQAVIDRSGEVTDLALDVFGELERVFAQISPHMADLPADVDRENWILQKLRESAAKRVGFDDPAAKLTLPAATEDLIRALASALSGPKRTSYRLESNSKPGQYYTLDVDSAGDVTCTCPGFEYRGACSHSRTLKAALVNGRSAPPAYQPA